MRISVIASGVGVDGRTAVAVTVVGAGPAAGPRPGVRRVLGRDAALTQLERDEGVDHDGRLVEVLGPERRLDGARLRPVRVAAGVQRDRAEVDARPLARLV